MCLFLALALTLTGGGGAAAAPNALAPDIVFRGNQALNAGELRKAAASELRAYAEHQGRMSDLDDAAYQMTLAYRQAGYAFAVVDYAQEQSPRGLQAVFTIAEGPQVFIRRVVWEGNKNIHRDELMALVDPESNVSKGTRPFVKAGLDRALQAIGALYREKGYLDIRIDPPQIDFSEDRRHADLRVVVHEGLQYRVTALVVEGDRVPSTAATLEKLRLAWVGGLYHPRQKLILKNQLQDALGDLGYADAQVSVVDRRPSQAGQVELVATVVSGPVVTIEEVEVDGNQKTRMSFVQRRLELQAGDRYSRRQANASSSNLYRSGLFSRVNLTLEPGRTADTRRLVVHLEEIPSREFFIEPGWGSYELLRLSLGLSENNLWGTGRRLGLELGGSFKAQRAVLRLTDPWFLDSAVTADIPLFFSRREEPSFTRTDYGAGVNFSKDLAAHLSTTLGYSLRKTKQSNIDVNPDDVDADEAYDLASVKGQLTFDDRDDPFYPTEGTRAYAGLEHAATFLGGSLDFSRLTTGVRYFRSLGWETVLGLRYTTGFIVPDGDTINVPLAERFFNGGENSVRSFKEQELGPKDNHNNPVGGMAFNTINIELRRLLTENFYTSLFADFGNVAPNRSRSEQGKDAYRSKSSLISATFNDYFSEMRPGIGMGVGYLLPIGPARIDLAFNPDADHKRDEDDWVVHFSIGMAF